MFSSLRLTFVLSYVLSLSILVQLPNHVQASPQFPTPVPKSSKFELIYDHSFSLLTAAREYTIRRQGNDSNCDYIAVSNGIQNIGGDGRQAYDLARQLVPQGPRDYKEGFYSLHGPQGSDNPFSINNLGAAPEAFVGVYEALGYNAVMLAAQPGKVDLAFAQAIRNRLLLQPDTSFAHLWITPRNYSVSRRIRVDETQEFVDLIYPYHEVVAMIAPDDIDKVVILDGLVGYPFTISLETLAYQLRGFNRVIVVSKSAETLVEHQQFQIAQTGQPYVVSPLGGQYLKTARLSWRQQYSTWGSVISSPLRMTNGKDPLVILPGRFVHYERIGTQSVTFALLGVQMGYDLERAGVLPSGAIQPWTERELTQGMSDWVIQQFGAVDTFTEIFGKPLTDEFWLTHDQLQQIVLRGVPLPQADQPGYIVVLTERAMLGWDSVHGTFMIPLGQVYYEQLRRELNSTRSAM